MVTAEYSELFPPQKNAALQVWCVCEMIEETQLQYLMSDTQLYFQNKIATLLTLKKVTSNNLTSSKSRINATGLQDM